MKKSLFIALGICITLNSCSKKNDTKSATVSPPVTINGTGYQTVVIGGQTWTAENYDGPGGTINPALSEGIYGKFYVLAETRTITLPVGWRIPTQADFTKLLESQGAITNDGNGMVTLDTVAGRHLRSASNWTISGDNKSGFNAQPAGEYNAYMNIFDDAYAYANFWSSTPGTNTVDTPSECIMVLNGFRTSPGTGNIPVETSLIDPTRGVLNYGFSLRFVKDN
jgi:uncharacterized protein (TIGR02145 family)